MHLEAGVQEGKLRLPSGAACLTFIQFSSECIQFTSRYPVDIESGFPLLWSSVQSKGKPIIDDQEPNTKTVVLQARHRKFSKIIMLRNILLDLKN